MDQLLLLLLCAAVGYLLGSISTGVIYSHYLGRDIRTQGSKNAGATNMTRVHGLKEGAITFSGDCLKGILSVLIGHALAGQNGALLAGLFAVIGHNWPLYFGFRGGKGVATCMGVLTFTFPPIGISAILLQLIMLKICRYVSLSSIIMFIFEAAGITIFYGVWPAGAWAILLAAMGIWRHRSNIQRLKAGTEPKIGQKA